MNELFEMKKAEFERENVNEVNEKLQMQLNEAVDIIKTLKEKQDSENNFYQVKEELEEENRELNAENQDLVT